MTYDNLNSYLYMCTSWIKIMTQNTFFVEWLNNNELQVFISIRSLKFLNQCLCNGSTSFKPF